jgi:agmatinase
MRTAGAEIVVMGAPYDITATHRPGARFGPRAVRQASSLVWQGAYDFAQDIKPFSEVRVVDGGDANAVPGDIDRSHQYIHDKVAEVLSVDAIPIIIGGDHSITLPCATAVAEKHGFGNVGLLHFDAHADTAPNNFGILVSHATPMRRLIESGAVPAKNFIQVGLRGYWPSQSVWRWMREQGLRSHLMAEIVADGFETVLERAIAEALDGPEKLYISVDIDVLDPAFAPGTGTPEPGGLNTRELLLALRRMTQTLDVVAMDVVEVSPPYDWAELTAMAANRCITEAITGIALRRKARAG